MELPVFVLLDKYYIISPILQVIVLKAHLVQLYFIFLIEFSFASLPSGKSSFWGGGSNGEGIPEIVATSTFH